MADSLVLIFAFNVLLLPLLVSGGCCQYALIFDADEAQLLGYTSTIACMAASSQDACPHSVYDFFDFSVYSDSLTCNYDATNPIGVCGVPIVVPPIAGSTITGDPILKTFDNRTLDFLGKPYHNYSLISGEGLALNMQLVPAGPLNLIHKDGSGTFVGAMAAILPGLSMLASVDKAGNMTYIINGLSADIEQPFESDIQGAQIKYEPYIEDLGQVLTIFTKPFQFEIVAVKQFSDEATGYNRGHLELKAHALVKPIARYSGVIGESLEAFNVSFPMGEARFEVPSLVYSAAINIVPSMTRHLLAHDVLNSHDLDFPITARLGNH